MNPAMMLYVCVEAMLRVNITAHDPNEMDMLQGRLLQAQKSGNKRRPSWKKED